MFTVQNMYYVMLNTVVYEENLILNWIYLPVACYINSLLWSYVTTLHHVSKSTLNNTLIALQHLVLYFV